jgi:hypothetical protein
MHAADGAADGAGDDVACLRRDARFAESLAFLRTFSATLCLSPPLRPLSADALEGALLTPAAHGALLAQLHARLTRRPHELDAPFWDEDGGGGGGGGDEGREAWEGRLARHLAGAPSLWGEGAAASPLGRGRRYVALRPAERVRTHTHTRTHVRTRARPICAAPCRSLFSLPPPLTRRACTGTVPASWACCTRCAWRGWTVAKRWRRACG